MNSPNKTYNHDLHANFIDYDIIQLSQLSQELNKKNNINNNSSTINITNNNPKISLINVKSNIK